MTKLELSLSVVLRTGMPVREERLFIRRAIAWATLESSCPFTEKRKADPIESHPSPSLTEAGMGMRDSGGEVWADNPPLKRNKAIKTLTNILVFQFSISCFSGRPAPKTIFIATPCSHKSRPPLSIGWCLAAITQQITAIA